MSVAPSEIIAIDRDGTIFLRAVCTECSFVGTMYEQKYDILVVNQANRHDFEHGDLSSL